MLLLVALLGCQKVVTTYVEGNDGALRLALTNPTSCSWCDPFDGVDSVQIDVYRGDSLLAQERFDWPGELVLPNLDGFGVVRVELRGLADGEVYSFARSPEITLAPGLTREVSVRFLPVGIALPLTSTLLDDRKRHRAITLGDGTVLLVGGVSPDGRLLTSAERFDPLLGTFSQAGFELPVALADAIPLEALPGEWLFVGGVGSLADGVESPSSEAVQFLESTGAVATIRPLQTPRAGGCVSLPYEGRAVFFGGQRTRENSVADFLRVDIDDGEWKFSDQPLDDLVDTDVTGCVTLAGGGTFIQGRNAANTGLWRYGENDGAELDPSLSFEAVNPEDPGAAAVWTLGSTLVALPDGDAWVGGGLTAESGALVSEAREFRAVSLRFDPATAQPTPRVFGQWAPFDEEGRGAYGCGWLDMGRTQAASSVEFVDLVSGATAGRVQLDDSRAGCSLTALDDGTLLVVGGSDGRGPTAELVVPLWE